jgi:DNA-binding Lrp family transcriptional regulator
MDYKNIITIKFAQAEQPKFEEKRAKGYVEFGLHNNYPEYLIGLFNESPKHGAIIKSKTNYIFGQGWDGVEQKANSKGETWNQVTKKCILDDELFGGYYIQVIYNLLGQIKDVYHLEYHKVRTNKEQNEFQVKNDWQDNKEKARLYPAFNIQDPVASQILFVKQYNPKSDIYPLPNYFQGLNYIESDVQVSRHILGNAKDGFVATTLINLNGGEPAEEAKEAVERGIKKKFTGSEGDRVVIMFNKSKDNSAEILPLSSTMLTKEDFTNVNNLIQQEIFACHQVTSPSLFGIKTEGQLGGSTEIRDAYTIFSNTYVNERQQAIEEIFNKLFEYVGIKGEYKLIPVEPLGFEFGEAVMAQNLTKDEIREIMGKEPLDPSIKTQAQVISDNINALSPLVANKVLESMTTDEIRSLAGLIPAVGGNVVPDGSMPAPQVLGNDSIKNLTGRQYQNVMRIVRQFTNGKLSKEQAALMLKNGFAFTDSDVNTFLGLDTETFSAVDKEIELVQMFEKFSENLDDYEVITSKSPKGFNQFAEEVVLSQLEADILNLISKDKRITSETIAEVLKQDKAVIEASLKNLVENNVIAAKEVKVGKDVIIERKKTDIKIDKPKTITLSVAYTYDWRTDKVIPEDARNSVEHPSRPFCVKMMQLAKTRLWSSANIQQMSVVLGYSVFDRVGGFWNNKGTIETQCRHEWKPVIIQKKK